jgi:DNA-binding FrmR family transcriptional regulator
LVQYEELKLMTSPDMHETHPEVLKRLKRAAGQLRSIGEMIEAGRPCLEVAQQLQAAERAVREAKKAFIGDHLNHCLDHVAETKGSQARASVDEFRTIAKYL